MTERTHVIELSTLVKHLHFLKPDISPLKLHKMLYLMHAVYLERKTEHTMPDRLFAEPFEAWQSGPVCRPVYEYMKKHAYTGEQWTPYTDVEKQTETIIQHVFAVTYNWSDYRFSQVTKNDKPFKQAIQNKKTTIFY